MKAGSLRIYVDESGRPEVFNKRGDDLLASGLTSNHLVVAAVRTTNPSTLGSAIAGVAPTGSGKPRVLHAVQDPDNVRRRVCRAIAAQDVIATAIVMDKRQLDPARSWQRDSARFYNEMLGFLLGDCLQLHERTEIMMSRKDVDAQKELQEQLDSVVARHKVILGRMAKVQPHSVSIHQVRHRDSRGLQAADYVAYAVFQAFERNEMEFYELLQPVLGRVWDLARARSYTRRDPMKNPP